MDYRTALDTRPAPGFSAAHADPQNMTDQILPAARTKRT